MPDMGHLLHNITVGDIGAATPDMVRQEVAQLIAELRESHTLAPLDPDAGPAPHRLSISAPNAAQLDLRFESVNGGQTSVVSLPLSALRRNLHDYGLIYDSFYNAVKSGDIHRLEAVDAGRRGVHDEAAADLQETMQSRLRLDKATARRLFSLIYILYKRQSAFL